jgi:hypothetical protein
MRGSTIRESAFAAANAEISLMMVFPFVKNHVGSASVNLLPFRHNKFYWHDGRVSKLFTHTFLIKTGREK